MKIQTEIQAIQELIKSPSCVRSAIHEFVKDETHENWLKLSKVFQSKSDDNQSIRLELLKGIVGHILAK